MFERVLLPAFKGSIQAGKVVLLYGPRRVGKTTFLSELLKDEKRPYLLAAGEDSNFSAVMEAQSPQRLRSSFAGYALLVIDEAQYISNIGLGLKMLVDTLPELEVIASGSSYFELAQQVGEPLTGRKRTYTLYPMSVLELSEQYGGMYVMERLEELLVYGSYPEVLSEPSRQEKSTYLHELRDAYLYKDILTLEKIRNARKIGDLLTLLAFQIGQEVSLSELGQKLDMSKQTVARYLDLLEKAFVIFNVRGFSRNLRKEVTKTSRYYFLDNGIRNAVINNFNPLKSRNDVGQLWENFVVMERAKTRGYKAKPANTYFWRTYDQQEVDLVEERDGLLKGFEITYSAKARAKEPKDWRRTYENASWEVIHSENFLDYLR